MNNPQHNLSLVRRLFDEVYNKGKLEVLDELAATNLRLHDAGGQEKEGLRAFKENESIYIKAFPNKKVTIDELISAEDQVIVRWTCEGEHKGELQGIAPTNKHFRISGINIYHISNNKISEINQSWDRLGLFEQIGEVQPAHALH